MRYHKLEGIILNKRSVGDSDRFYTIYCRDAGKISVYARSVRNLKSKRAGTLDLYSLIKFELVERGERKTLTHVELVDGYRAGKKKLGDISRLFAFGELIDSLLAEDDPHPEVYDLFKQALTHLSRFDTPQYLVRFKKKLLVLLGFWDPSLTDADLDPYIESLLSRPLRAKITQ